jgi:hypothetical protein
VRLKNPNFKSTYPKEHQAAKKRYRAASIPQVEYFQRLNPASTVQQTGRINRHRRSVEVEVTPCTEYFYKVIASEDWKGLREDFKVS